MHGAILVELQHFVEQGFGQEAWDTILDDAGVGGQIFMPIRTYPDETVLSIVGAACELTGKPASEVLTLFGEHLAPALMRDYVSLLERDWRTLDVLEHIEHTVHRVVRRGAPGATPPELECERRSPTEVAITYRSPRQLCALAKGLIRGLAAHYREDPVIAEPECMLRGAPACILVTKVG